MGNQDKLGDWEGYFNDLFWFRGRVFQVLDGGKKAIMEPDSPPGFVQLPDLLVDFSLANRRGITVALYEGRYIRVVGLIGPLYTYTTILGAKRTIPRIDAVNMEPGD